MASSKPALIHEYNIQEQRVTTRTKHKIIVCNAVPFKQFLNRPRWAEAPRFADSRHMKVVRFSAIRTGRLNSLGNMPSSHLNG